MVPFTHTVKDGFTLIELLVVVAILAILSAVAVPNFLEAQTRSKISRVKNDMRSTASAIEMYHVDNNAYPPGYQTAPRYGLDVLSTPVAYLTTGIILDPFKAPGLPVGKSSLTYELMNIDNKTIERGGGAYSVDPLVPNGEPTIGIWWWLGSRGPNGTFGFRPSEPEFDIRQRFFQANSNTGQFLDCLYDATNGTNSNGNIFRASGQTNSSAAARCINNQ